MTIGKAPGEPQCPLSGKLDLAFGNPPWAPVHIPVECLRTSCDLVCRGRPHAHCPPARPKYSGGE